MKIDIPFKHSETIDLALDTVKKDKQALIFVNTKNSAEKQAEDISKQIKDIDLEELSYEILNVLSTPTKQCKRLADCVKKGIAFHHSGLNSKQRELIEDNFRTGVIKIICCTPTLCLSGDSEIWSGINEIKASSLTKSNSLLVLSSQDIVKMKPQEIHKIENSSELVKISSVSGNSIKLTPNHRMFIKRNGKKILLNAKDIKKGDKIATIGKLKIKPKAYKLSDFVLNNKLPIKNKIISNDFFYFVGVMLGDGYSGVNFVNNNINYKGSPCIVGIDNEVFKRVKKVCESLNISTKKSKTQGGTPQLILGKNKWFRELLVRCGIEQRENKKISKKLMNSNLKNISLLLSGLFDTDGCVEKKGLVSFSNISLNLIKNVQKSLLRFGIVSRVRKKPASTMEIYEKEYNTKICYELIISNKRCILDFYKHIGFKIKRKQDDLIKIVSKITSNYNYVSCLKCNYKIYKDLFEGRSISQKNWGLLKKEIISILGKNDELSSREIKKLINNEPKKNSSRLNHHYELIQKRRTGSRSKTEWFWSLNNIGKFIYKEIIINNKPIFEFLRSENCPICNKKLDIFLKKGWRDSDFEGDIYWDIIRSVGKIKKEGYVYDIVLPSKPKNNHLFVAEGFLVHNSAGLDLPAFRAIIKDLKRFTQRGMQFIPVLEYMQMAGRAGRPKFDSVGEAICIAKSDSNNEEIIEKYINGKPEDIYSKLAAEPVLRTYVLSLIASELVGNKKELMEFFEKTFFAHQYEDLEQLTSLIMRVVGMLKEWEFISVGNGEEDSLFQSADSVGEETYKATLLGKRISELYLDPYTASKLIEGLKNNKEKIEFSYLHLISNTLEMRPLLSVTKAESEDIETKLELSREYILDDKDFFEDYYTFMSSIKTAFFLEEWINERDEDFLLTKFKVRPGEIKYKTNIADWLLYSCHELAKLLMLKKQLSNIVKLRLRLQYGVKEELLPLVKIKGIGKVRARKLFNNDIKDVRGLKKADLSMLKRIVGDKVAVNIKKQLLMG